MNLEERIARLYYAEHDWDELHEVDHMIAHDYAQAVLKDEDIARGLELLAMEKAGELYTLDMLQGPPTNPHCAESAADEKNEIAYWKMVGFWDSDKAHNTAGFRKVNQLKPLPEEQDNGEEGTASEAPHI